MNKLLLCLMCVLLLVGMAGCHLPISSIDIPKIDIPKIDLPKIEDPETDGSKIDGSAEPDETVLPISLTVGEKTKPEYYKDTYDELIVVSYPAIFLCNGDETKYPELSLALESFNQQAKEDQLEFLRDSKSSAEEFYLMMDKQPIAFESETSLSVRRADTLVTSFLCCDYVFSGGMHGNSYYYGKNFNTQTGESLKLSQVVNDNAAFIAAIQQQLKVFWNENEPYNEEWISDAVNDVDKLSWTLDYNGITIYFSPYEIASYAAGVQVVTLSNEEYPNILKSEYKEVPKAYGIELLQYAPFYTDVTGDGKVDEICFSAYNYTDYEGSGAVRISVNDTIYEEEQWFYEVKPTLVHTKDGKNYLYVEMMHESEIRDIQCYQLSGSVKNIGTVDSGYRTKLYESDDIMITCDVLTNPEDFYLEFRTQHLSTMPGYKCYAVEQNGLPQTRDLRFHFEESYMPEFTLLQNLEAEIYDENKENVIGKTTVKAGDKVLYYSTDNETYGYFKQSDGTILRVRTAQDPEYWSVTINGQKLEDLFEGIMFAG